MPMIRHLGCHFSLAGLIFYRNVILDNSLHSIPIYCVTANILAPKGRVWIQAGAVAEGIFSSQQVLIGRGVQVTLRSVF
jgi:hypothetical protein